MKNENQLQSHIKLEIEKESDGQLWIGIEGENKLIAKICHGELPNGKIEVTKEEKTNAHRMVKAWNMLNPLIVFLKDVLDKDVEPSWLQERAKELLKQAEQK